MPNTSNVTEIAKFPAIDELIEYCKSFNRIKELSKGDSILDQNAETKYIHLIGEGYVKTYDITTKGSEKIVTVMGAGHLFPLTWVFKTEPIRYHFFSECLTDVKIYLAPHDEVYKYIGTRNDVLLELLDLSARRIINYAGINEYLITASLEDRLIYILYFLGLKFGRKKNPIALLPFRLSHQDLASLVGASREATTLNMNNLIKKGFVQKTDGCFCIHLDKIDHSKLPKIYNYRTY